MTRFIWQGKRISFFTAFIFSYYACGLQAPMEVTHVRDYILSKYSGSSCKWKPLLTAAFKK